jgi:tetratricopeptide (TPR) repeat protein
MTNAPGKTAHANPFPGLRPFEEDEYRLFFGREGQSDALVERLERSRFLAIVGTSGSGKSSLVRAGLLPALRGGMMAGAGAGWSVAVLRPGHDPLGNLARALADVGVLAEAGAGLAPAEREAVIEATLRGGSLGLVEAAARACAGEGQKLLVVVDQFEELFRFRAARAQESATDDDASAFVKLLLEAARQRDLPIYVVLTMRSDFLGDCAQFQGLPEAINDGQYLIPRMTRDERRFAIAGPARVARGRISEPLVNRLLNDVGDNPDQLPILQHALMRTWDYWAAHRHNSEPVGLEHYEAVGTMANALSLHADEAWDELPDDRARQVAEALFKSLTERGADNREIRRPTALREVCEIAGASPAEVAAVVEVFRREGRSFLMPPADVALTPETVIDISHESLIRNWARLHEWVRDEGEAARIYRRLAEAAVANRAGEGGLLDDVTLAWVNRWRDRYHPNRAWGVRYHPEYDAAMAYLEESRAASEKRIADAQEREQRELARAHAFAEQQVRAAHRLRRLSVALGVILLLALGSAVYAFNARADAVQSRKVAEESARLAFTEKERALESAREAKLAQAEALRQKEAASASEKVAVTAQERAAAEEAHAEAEAERASEQAGVARRKAAEAQEATREANIQRVAAEENAQQVAGALERGELIRSGLESYRRGDINLARTSFERLLERLKPLQPDAPAPPGSRNFTPQQSKQFVRDYGWALSHLGDVYHKSPGDYGKKHEEAIEAYEQARVVLEKLLQGERAAILFETYNGLAHAYHDNALQQASRTEPSRLKLTAAEQFGKAEVFYTKALEYLKATAGDDPLPPIAGYKNLAQLYLDMDRFKEAEENLKLVVAAYKAVEDIPVKETVGALEELAEFYRGQGRYVEAAETYTELTGIQERLGGIDDAEDLRVLADYYGELGQVYSALKKDDEKYERLANDTFQLADKLQQMILKVKHKGPAELRPGGSAGGLANDLDELGDLYLKLGRNGEAWSAYEQALLIKRDVSAEKNLLAASYVRMARLFEKDARSIKSAEDSYNSLIQTTEGGGGSYAGETDMLRLHVEGLRGLGALYASKEMFRPAEAEALFNRALAALAPVHGRLAWRDVVATYSALLDLYGRQPNKEREIGLTYTRKLESMTKLYDEFKLAHYRTEDYPPFMAAYYKTLGEVAAFRSARKDTGGAEAVCRQAAADTGRPFIDEVRDPKQLEDVAAAVAQCQAVLGGRMKPDESARLDQLLREARARIGEVEKSTKR